jgi:beta-lactamase superfamily II metal-dependent hydrolase
MIDELFLILWDVQHGSAAYLRTPNGKHIAFDLGTGSFNDGNSTFSPLLHLKQNYGVSRLDQVIITHPHRDHIDDIYNFDALNPRVLHRPKHLLERDIRGDARNSKFEQSKIDKYLEVDAKYSEVVSPQESPTLAANNGLVDFASFTPFLCPRDNINNHSIVTVVTFMGLRILIPGDNEKMSWDELLAQPGFKNAIAGTDILVASHHGRENGYSDELFKFIKPQLVLISDGPEGTTSVTDWYRNSCTEQGSSVYHAGNKRFDPRWVLPTRNDGTLRVRVGWEDGKRIWRAEIGYGD